MNKNTIQKLLYIFSPNIKFKGQSIVCSNHNDLPCDFLLLKELYSYFDLGLIHSSKCFHIEQLPNELSKYIIEYLNQNEESLKNLKMSLALDPENSLALSMVNYLENEKNR